MLNMNILTLLDLNIDMLIALELIFPIPCDSGYLYHLKNGCKNVKNKLTGFLVRITEFLCFLHST